MEEKRLFCDYSGSLTEIEERIAGVSAVLPWISIH